MGLFGFGKKKEEQARAAAQAAAQKTAQADEAFYQTFLSAALGDEDAKARCRELCRDEAAQKRFVLRVKAEAGQQNAEAQFLLGYLYVRGNMYTVSRSKDAAREWYEKAAQGGHAAAQCICGEIYARGDGVPCDREKAFDWYQKSAQQGYREAQFRCGGKYQSGIGVKKDYDKFIYWMQKAAEQGHAEAQCRLAQEYEGRLDDKTKALYWYQQAAQQGFARGQEHCGALYARGEGTEQDKEKARFWLQKAAEQGSPYAQSLLDSL